ncbi:NUMOD3 domain-containing DNA-binding protein [Mesorhizobium sp. B263B2A]|uniref:NUMOD3 domain-containing DNA-binding protein n=1 Tax=Mesorhizobium sp. B263B2A TaxID=2876669 RepID=UPI001CD0A3F3|nr:NUMOD3 domain-containing DNA-binding protein [Mesorhizobium sp. B263B2A]MCA0032763.1 hypothetical protein [Mesorhizobium sp. B263B2A]
MAPASLAACMAEIKANPGKRYVYILHRPDGSPFYVGVGTKRRIMHHERNAESAKQSAKYKVMRAIAASGEVVGYSISGWFNDWKGAAAEERRLIALYGRADKGAGSLSNRTNGGQGQSGSDWYTPARLAAAKMVGEKARGRKLSPERLAKMSAGMKGHVWRQETLDRRSAALKGKPLTEEHKAKLSAAKKGRPLNDACNAAQAKWMAANRDKVSEKFRRVWADPESRARLELSRDARMPSKETRAKLTAAILEKMKDPEFIARRAAAIAAATDNDDYRQKQREKAKQQWADPAFREKMKAAKRNA